MFGRKKKKADTEIDETAAAQIRDEALEEQDSDTPKPRRAAVDTDAADAAADGKAEDAVDARVTEVDAKDADSDTLAPADALSEQAEDDGVGSDTDDDENDDGEAKDAGADDSDDEDGEADDAEDEDAEDEEEEPVDEWEELQNSKDWRDDGPFDYDEVDLEGDEVQRVDFGSLILTPTENSQLQLQVEQESGNVQAALVMIGQSGLEVALFAAPKSGGLAKTVREEMLASVEQTGGTCEFSAGPFGAEVRRIVPVRLPDGQEGLHVSRTWLVEGPRWLLRGVLMGEACVSDDEAAEAEFVEFFKNLIVRRGDLPLPPGDLIPMTLPDDLKPPAPEA